MAYASVFNALGSIDRGTGTVTTVDLSTNQTSGVFSPTGEALTLSYQFEVVSGTPSGTFYVDVSNDVRCLDPVFATSAKWEVASSTLFTTGTAPNGSAGCFIVMQNGARFSRCRWVQSASTGTGTATGYQVSL